MTRTNKVRRKLRSKESRRRLFCEQLEARQLLAANVFTVENLDDSGPGSLRQAVIDANKPAAGVTATYLRKSLRPTILIRNT